MIELGDRDELDRNDFATYLEGRQAPRLSWPEIVIPWLFSLAQMALQIMLIGAALHAL